MLKVYRFGFLAALVLMLALGAALIHGSFGFDPHAVTKVVSPFAMLLFGAVVVNYKTPFGNGTVLPTVTQMMNQNSLSAQVTALDADTLITIVHNWGAAAVASGVSAVDVANWPAELLPFVQINLDGSATSTVVPLFTVSTANTNQVVITKNTTVGTQGTYDVILLRPHSYIK